jgi:hypothetical protein
LAAWVAAACALSAGALAPVRAATPPRDPEASAAPDPAQAFEDDLASMSRELADARALFDDKVALRADSALEMLSRAQVAFFEEDYPLAVARLLELTARPDFQRSPGYGEALTWLGESMWQLGFHAAAATELRRALARGGDPRVDDAVPGDGRADHFVGEAVDMPGWAAVGEVVGVEAEGPGDDDLGGVAGRPGQGR